MVVVLTAWITDSGYADIYRPGLCWQRSGQLMIIQTAALELFGNISTLKRGEQSTWVVDVIRSWEMERNKQHGCEGKGAKRNWSRYR